MKIYLIAAFLAGAFVAAAPTAARAAESASPSETKAEYMKKARARLDELGARIDALEVKFKKTGAAADEGLKKRIAALKKRRQAARKSFAALKRASGEAWRDLKAGFDAGLEDIQRELDDAKKE